MQHRLVASLELGRFQAGVYGRHVPKIRRLRDLIDERGLRCDIEVDGGINEETAPGVVEAGANLLVAGSAVYGHKEGVAAAIERLKASVRGIQYKR